MTRNHNASTRVAPIEPPVKCANCGEIGSVIETEVPGIPFACMACEHWGDTEATTDNPTPEDWDYYNPTGQVVKRPTE